jgi:2-methylcitrate dehydratase
LIKKFAANLAARLSPSQRQAIMDVCLDAGRLRSMPVDKFIDIWVVKSIG